MAVRHEVVVGLMQPGADYSVLEFLRPPEWTARAACRGSTLSFVPSGAGKWREVPDELAAICGRCKVRDECLAMAMADSSLDRLLGWSERPPAG